MSHAAGIAASGHSEFPASPTGPIPASCNDVGPAEGLFDTHLRQSRWVPPAKVARSRLQELAAHQALPSVALGGGGHGLPFPPGREPELVVRGRDAQRRLAQEQAQRRVRGIHERQHRVAGGARIAGREAPGAGLRRLLPDLLVSG